MGARLSMPAILMLVLTGCAMQVQTAQQTRTEADVFDCARDIGARDAKITYVAPDGSFRYNAGAGEWSVAQSNAMRTCLGTKGHRDTIYDRAASAPPSKGSVTPSPGTTNTQKSVASVSGAAAVPPTVGAVLKPMWAVGDEWSYRFESPTGKGTFVWVVDRFDAIYRVVLKSGNRETFYRRSDGAHYVEKVGGTIEVRNTPPGQHGVVAARSRKEMEPRLHE